MAVVDGDWRWPYRFSEWAPGGLHIFQYRRVPSLSRVCMQSISRSVRSFVFLRSFAVGVLLVFFPRVLQSRQPFAIFFLLPRSVQLFAWRGRNRYNAMSIVRQNVWNIHNISCGLIFAFCILIRISNQPHWFFFWDGIVFSTIIFGGFYVRNIYMWFVFGGVYVTFFKTGDRASVLSFRQYRFSESSESSDLERAQIKCDKTATIANWYISVSSVKQLAKKIILKIRCNFSRCRWFCEAAMWKTICVASFPSDSVLLVVFLFSKRAIWD